MLVSRERNEAETQGQQAREAVHLLAKGADIGFDDQLDAVQKEMLEKALTYFEKFTSRAAGNPALRLEHGQAYQQMGDLQRKLGRLGDSEAAYRKAIAMLEPLTGDAGVGREAKRSLARTRTLLGDLLVRRGADKGQADELYRRAVARRSASWPTPSRTRPPAPRTCSAWARPTRARATSSGSTASSPRPGRPTLGPSPSSSGPWPPTPSSPRPATSWHWPSPPAA